MRKLVARIACVVVVIYIASYIFVRQFSFSVDGSSELILLGFWESDVIWARNVLVKGESETIIKERHEQLKSRARFLQVLFYPLIELDERITGAVILPDPL